MSSKEYDVFISHASEDKEKVARPLKKALEDAGISVWFDETALKWGDSLMESIGQGLKEAIFGIVIFSPSFFDKKWPQLELEALLDLTKPGERKILPLRYNLSHDDLAQKQPLLSGKLSRSWSDGADVLVKEVKELLKNDTVLTKSEENEDVATKLIIPDDELFVKEREGFG